METVLVTGATGFVGNYVINVLLERGNKIIATSLNEEKAKGFDWYKRVNYIPFNFNEMDARQDFFSYFLQPDRLIHLAWEGLPNYNNEFHVHINLANHSGFIKNLIEGGLKDITVSGTCFEYGMKEGCLDEGMPAEPDNYYGIAKNSLRIFIEKFQNTHSVKLKWVRLFYLYGKGQYFKSLISQLENEYDKGSEVFNMSGGQQTRDFLRVEKAAEYLVRISLQDSHVGIINCCSGKGVTVEAFVRNYLKEMNKSIKLNLGYHPYSEYEPFHFWGSNVKLKKIIGI
jgi:dTDP-6-deoxy-L-talose 4-dehydrogenase (NAD+)